MRWGLIGGLALGGLTLLVGPERVGAGLAQIRTKAQDVIDQAVDDPVALRRQLEQLAEEYPDRIAKVRGEMAEVDHQLGEVSRDIEIAGRVIAYTAEDLTVLQSRIAKAESELEARLASTGAAPKVYIRFEGIRFTLDEAYGEVLRIGNLRETYRDRKGFDQEQVKMLEEQKARLSEILQKLEEDFGTYQSQLWALDRQIDAIERNDRLIEMMEQQQQALAGYDRYEKATNFKQIKARLAELRAVQQAQIETLRKHGWRSDYVKKAEADLESEVQGDVLDELLENVAEPTEGVQTSKNSVAWAAPIVIE